MLRDEDRAAVCTEARVRTTPSNRSADPRGLSPGGQPERGYGFGVKTKVGFGEKRPGSDFGSGSSPGSPAFVADDGGDAELSVLVEAEAAVTITAFPDWPAVDVEISLPLASL